MNIKSLVQRIIFCVTSLVLVLAAAFAFSACHQSAPTIDYTPISENYITELHRAHGLTCSTFFSASQELGRITQKHKTTVYPLDRSFCFVLTSKNQKNSGTLYYISQDGIREVREEIYNFATADIPIVAYIVCENNADIGSLYLHNLQNDETIHLADSVNLLAPAQQSISPGGDAVAYCRDNGDGSFTGMVWHAGQTFELGLHSYPVAISDGAEFVYYYRLDPSAAQMPDSEPPRYFCMYSAAEQREMFAIEGAGASVFNRDLSETIFQRGTDLFFSAEGRNPQHLAVGFQSRLISNLPDLAHIDYRRYGLSTLVGQYFTSRTEVEEGKGSPGHFFIDHIWRVDADGGTELFQINSIVDDVQLNDKGEFVLHIDDSLYYAKNERALRSGKLELLMSDILSKSYFQISRDFRDLYFSRVDDETDTIYYYNCVSGEEPVPLCSDVDINHSTVLIDRTLYFRQLAPSDATGEYRSQLFCVTPSESLEIQPLPLARPDSSSSGGIYLLPSSPMLPSSPTLCLVVWSENSRKDYRLYNLTNNRITEVRTLP